MRVTRSFAGIAGVYLALVACAPPAGPGADTAADQAAIRAIDVAHSKAEVSGDADSYLAAYADDAVVMAPDAPAVTGREAIRKAFSEGAANMPAGESQSYGDYTVTVSGDMAWSSGTYKLTSSAGAPLESGKFLTTWHKANGKWLAVRDIWNSDAPPPAATPPK